MTLMELADLLGVDLIITRHANRDGNFTAHLKGVYLKGHEKESGGKSVRGEHARPETAADDYVNKLKGKTIVINPFDRSRMEFKVPETLEYWII